VLVSATHPAGGVVAALIAVATWLAYAGFGASYTLYSFAITADVVLLLSPLGGNELSTVVDRGLDTLLGGVLALAAYAIWPTWERGTLRSTTRQLIGALSTYSTVLLTGYADPESVDRSAISTAAAAARRARIAAQASLNRAIAEPSRAGADTDTAASVLAASRRIVIALHALRATLDDATEHAAVPEVIPIRDEIATTLNGLAAGQDVAVEGLRERQHSLAADDPNHRDAASLHTRRRVLVAAHLDPLVDSVDTLAHVITSAESTAG
jgi:uncharacterized membrane protein YccC